MTAAIFVAITQPPLLTPPAQIAETYAFLPREAVTRFLMSCGECQKRMHISTTGQDYKGTNTTLQQTSKSVTPLISV